MPDYLSIVYSTCVFNPEQRLEVLKFLKRKYQRVYKTCPDLLEKDELRYFFTQQERQITGLLGLEFSNGNQFGFENLMICEPADLYFGRVDDRKNYVYMSRWVAEQTQGVQLLRSGLAWAVKNNRQYLLACSKPRIIKYLRDTLHLPVFLLRAQILENNIPIADANFYLTHPQPLLYMGDCRIWLDVLDQRGLITPDVH